MDELLNTLRLEAGNDSILNLWQVFAAMLLCLLCVLLVGWVYRFTHRTMGYSQSYVQTLVLMGLVTTIIMMVIGSNIARAFSLVGALSIIRFRNAIKETRDVGYIFWAMAIAMACGTGFFGVGVLGTAFISCVLIGMHLLDYGSSRADPERMLRVQLPGGADPDGTLGTTLQSLFRSYSIILVESVRQGLLTEVLLAVRPRPKVSGSQVIDEISKVNDNLKVTYNYALHTDDV